MKYLILLFFPFYALAQCPTSHNFATLDSTWVIDFDQSPNNNVVDVDTTDNDTVDYQLTGDFLDTDIYSFNIPMSEGVIFYNLRFRQGGPQTECNGYNQALPVELLSFELEAKRSKLVLSWSTATETNNDRFEVERSEDGKRFYMVGVVRGSGTTSQMNRYTYEVEKPVRTAYFRLKQIDHNNENFEYSNIISYSGSGNDSKFTFSVYPGQIQVSIPSQVYDLTGREVARLNEGVNYIELQPGMYFLANKIKTIKFVK